MASKRPTRVWGIWDDWYSVWLIAGGKVCCFDSRACARSFVKGMYHDDRFKVITLTPEIVP